jgi:hypothetical protein
MLGNLSSLAVYQGVHLDACMLCHIILYDLASLDQQYIYSIKAARGQYEFMAFKTQCCISIGCVELEKPVFTYICHAHGHWACTEFAAQFIACNSKKSYFGNAIDIHCEPVFAGFSVLDYLSVEIFKLVFY